jgi:uncharacterized repeat protein (TIGR01451 family)
MREGSFIAPPYNSPGTYTVVLTVRRATGFGGFGQSVNNEDTARFEVVVKEPEPEEPEETGADLSVTKRGSPEIYFPGDTIMTYTITVENLGPKAADGVTLVDTLPPELEVIENPGCLDTGQQLICQIGTLRKGQSVELAFEMDAKEDAEFGPFIENKAEVGSETADPNPANNTATVQTALVVGQRTSIGPFTSTSLLRFTQTDEPSTGIVVLNGGRVDTTTSGVPFQHRFQGRPGRNTIEAYLSGAGKEGLWRFDFSGAQAFVAGSFRAEAGQVVSRDAHGIVFRVSGTAGERIRFSFELSSRR